MSPEVAGAVHAPAAPGRIGVPIDPQAALVYLEALGRWRDDRQRELNQLDQAALANPQKVQGAGGVTADIMLSMALWKAVSDRYELLVRVWDSGRVGASERERMSSLIWGRLDATLDPGLISRSTVPGNSALAVSLPEACRLSDALASQLRVRLGLEVSGEAVTEPRSVRCGPRWSASASRSTSSRPGRRSRRPPGSSPGSPDGSRRSPTRPAAAATSAGCSGRWRSRRPRSSAT